MSDEYFDTDDTPEGDADDTESTFVPDPATIAFLDQEAAAFHEIADEFAEVYGFAHDCHCDEDYSAGRVGEVTECYAGMIVDSLATCARLNHENKQLKQMVTTLMEMNTTLMNTEEDNGSEGEGVEFLDNPNSGDGEADQG